MALKLMYITNRPEIAQIAQDAGVDRIFVDMEYIGKADRQKGIDSVQSYHTVEDVRKLRPLITSSDLLVRVNPIHDPGSYRGIPHGSSEEEINAVIEAGADIVMLPYFKTLEEIRRFISCVGGRAKTMLLLETAEAERLLEDILEIDGIDEYHIGLNDLGLEKGKTFLFELLSDGTVGNMCRIMSDHGRVYGFGGVASPGKGLVPAEFIVREHYRYGSSLVILSRSFCNANLITDPEEVREIFRNGVKGIRELEKECEHYSQEEFRKNHEELKRRVQMVVDAINSKNA